MRRLYWTHIMASRRNGTLYVGVTNDLVRRVWEHREGTAPGFTQKYGVKTLVHYEPFGEVGDAIHREKRLKSWKRRWKLELIEETNPQWRDRYEEVIR